MVFDCDGVLVDSEPVSRAAWCQTLAENGIDVESELERWTGTTDVHIARHYSELAGVSAEDLLDRASQALARLIETQGVDVFEDAMQAVAEAVTAELAVAVATNSERWRLEALLSAAGIAGRIPVSVARDDVARPKPAPDIYLRAAELLGVGPRRCLVVEDSPTGITAALRAGMRVVALDRGVFALADLADATRVVGSLTSQTKSSSE